MTKLELLEKQLEAVRYTLEIRERDVCNLLDRIDGLHHENRKLSDRLDQTSDRLDWETGNRIFHEKRAERLTWFIEHLTEQIRTLANESDIKFTDEIEKRLTEDLSNV